MTSRARSRRRGEGTKRQGGVTAVAAKRRRVGRILNALKRVNPAVRAELNYQSPFELLVATMLSAQSTDQQVNRVTPLLFSRYQKPAEYATASPAEVEQLIRPTGLFKAKARNLIACGRALSKHFAGDVPRTMDHLVSLPGVGRKTANVVLGHAFGQPGIVVDTHVQRVSHRLGLARSSDPERIERELQQLIPRKQWTKGSQRLLLHGRYVCTARSPQCPSCAIYWECPWTGKSRR